MTFAITYRSSIKKLVYVILILRNVIGSGHDWVLNSHLLPLAPFTNMV